MLPSHLHPHRMTLPINTQRWTEQLGSLMEFSTFVNRSRTSCRKTMPSISNAMINIGFHIPSKWVTRFGYTCRKSVSPGLTESFTHFIMGHTPSLRQWATMLLNYVFPRSLASTQSLMWTSFAHIFHHCWTHRR